MGAAVALLAQYFPAVGRGNRGPRLCDHQVARHCGEKLRPLSEVVRRIRQDERRVFALRHLGERVSAHDGAAVGNAERIDVVFQRVERALVALDERHVARTARDCLDAEGAGASETVDDSCTCEVVVATETVEDRLPRHICRGSRGVALGRLDAATAQLPCHHSHAFTVIVEW